MIGPTASDGRRGWAIDDPVVRLRVRGGERSFALPPPPIDEWTVGAAPDCALVLDDPTGRVSRHHARLERAGATWTLRDLASTNGIRADGELRLQIQLAPGVEVDLGGVGLVAESERLAALRAYLARLIGWSPARGPDVDRALRAVREWAHERTALVVCGDGDLSEIAARLHALLVGDPRALYLCESRAQAPLLDRAAIIELPPLASRPDERERLIHAYAVDAATALGAAHPAFRPHEMVWLARVPLDTHAQLVEAAHRLVALRNWGVTGGAQRLGISHVALSRWASRRRIPT